MRPAVVVSTVNPIRWLLLVALVLLAACSPSPSGSQVSPSPSILKGPPPTLPATPTPTPTASDATTVTFSAIQRLNVRVGYVAGWNGGGAKLAKTSDGGTTWQRLSVPADYLTSLRFIDERVGWAGGFVNRDVPQVACHQAAPAGAQPCKGVVLRTQDGGQTWQTVLAIPTDSIQGEPIRQIQAVDDGSRLLHGERLPEIRALPYGQRRTELVESGQPEGRHGELFGRPPRGPALRQHRARLDRPEPGRRRRECRPRGNPQVRGRRPDLALRDDGAEHQPHQRRRPAARVGRRRRPADAVHRALHDGGCRGDLASYRPQLTPVTRLLGGRDQVQLEAGRQDCRVEQLGTLIAHVVHERRGGSQP